MYSRFRSLKNYGKESEDKLRGSTAAVIGLGSTGSVIAENLARHGVNLILIDRDYLELNDVYSSNIYELEDCNKSLPKAKAAEDYLEQFTSINSMCGSFNSKNLSKVNSADIIMDGADNLKTRKIINQYSTKEDIPWVYTAAIAQKGYSMFMMDKCFNSLTKKNTKVATCETEGIMREIAQITASKSSLKAIKYLSGKKVSQNLEIIPENRELEVEKCNCELCLESKYKMLDEPSKTSEVCGNGKYQFYKETEDKDLSKIAGEASIKAQNEYLTRLEYKGYQIVVFKSGRVISEGKDSGHAESLISEAVGI